MQNDEMVVMYPDEGETVSKLIVKTMVNALVKERMHTSYPISYDDMVHLHSDLMTMIEGIPPIMHVQKCGKWIYHKNDMGCVRFSHWECSECGKYTENKTDFCPNCGARMTEQK